jgi:hypothetical protein
VVVLVLEPLLLVPMVVLVCFRERSSVEMLPMLLEDSSRRCASPVTGQWLLLGEAADVRRSGERGAILEVLKEACEPLSPADVAEITGFKRENVKKLLREMAKAGEAQSLGPRKGYIHPLRADLRPPGSHGYQVTRDGE